MPFHYLVDCVGVNFPVKKELKRYHNTKWLAGLYTNLYNKGLGQIPGIPNRVSMHTTYMHVNRLHGCIHHTHRCFITVPFTHYSC